MITRRRVLAAHGRLRRAGSRRAADECRGTRKGMEAMEITRAGSQPSGKGPAE